ncbi:hypothetical protein EDF56_104590 [Novosphingobium sp. PhB165]|uniref:hypothetical protein n=1 Tax=Novosphingobium sp. PhB165 TaxID=2485105 RepID=UPI00104EBEA6|nr:hypothetical protein [Novosphingobium sp. PhB165]TCM19053.1 hypothetical protein EDF56_104590 [Novosphingobium sp. PhB165]
MGPRIDAKMNHRLRLTGDIEVMLDVLAPAQAKGFSLGFSDGTLVREYGIPGRPGCRFAIASEGAAMVKFVRYGLDEAIDPG